MDGLIEGAAGSFNFTNTSFLPEDAQNAINDFVGSNVSAINITGVSQLVKLEMPNACTVLLSGLGWDWDGAIGTRQALGLVMSISLFVVFCVWVWSSDVCTILDYVFTFAISIRPPAFTDQLNQAILAFDIDQAIVQLNNVSSSLADLGQTTLTMQVDDIVMGLENIRDTQIPTIQNQAVSSCQFSHGVVLNFFMNI